MSGYRAHISFGWTLAAYLMLGLAVSSAAIFFNAGHRFGGSYAHAGVTMKATALHALSDTAELNTCLAILVGALVCLASIFASHRISGPVYRMGKSAESVAEGDFSGRVRVRRRDYLQETVREMDLTFEVLRGRLSEIKTVAEEVRCTAADIGARHDEVFSDEEELSRLAGKLEEGHARLRERLSYFHTS